jgi:hypothetical protein
MNKSAAFIAAPYGFGPSSKAIAISSHLPRSIDRVFFSDGPPLELAQRSNEFSSCVQLDFTWQEDRVAELLSSHSVLVFVNSTRFIPASSREVGSIILVDTLAWLRKSRPACSRLLTAYFAQRFFDHCFSTDITSMENFHAVGAIVPTAISVKSNNRNHADSIRVKSPLIHCGGLCSPAMYQGADEEFVEQMFESIKTIKEPLRVVLPKHLHNPFLSRVTEHVSLIDCSPLSVHEHISGSSFSLTTSGIEFTYESLFLGVPTLSLPPFNATQYLQLEYHQQSFNGCVPFHLAPEQYELSFACLDKATGDIQKRGVRDTWRTQFEMVASRLEKIMAQTPIVALDDLRRKQLRAVQKVGSNGAQIIATHVVQSLHKEEVLQ